MLLHVKTKRKALISPDRTFPLQAFPGIRALTPNSTPNSQRGFTYLALLLVVATMGAGMAAYGEFASHAAQREKEAELLWIGNEFREAILRYYESSPGPDKRYPRTLDDLIRDERFPGVRRYLRRIYADPMTGHANWALIRAPDGGIMGVHSVSEQAVLKIGNFRLRDAALEGARRYSDWKFYYAPTPQMAPAGALSRKGS